MLRPLSDSEDCQGLFQPAWSHVDDQPRPVTSWPPPDASRAKRPSKDDWFVEIGRCLERRVAEGSTIISHAGTSLVIVTLIAPTAVLLMLAAGTPGLVLAQSPTPDTVHFEIGAADALGLVRQASGLALAPDGSLYVVDGPADRIQRFGREGGPLAVSGANGPAPGWFDGPSAIAVANDGDVYVADSGNDRIQRFDSSGAFVMEWGADGNSDARLHAPVGVAVGIDGGVFVSDSEDHVVKRYAPDGSFVDAFGQEGPEADRLDRPRDLAIGPDGSVYVIDFGHDRIQRFTPEGERIMSFRADEPFNPDMEHMWLSSIAIGSDGAVFAAKFHRVHHFDEAGRDLGEFDLGSRVVALAIDGAERLFAGVSGSRSFAVGVIDITERPPYRRISNPSVQFGVPSSVGAPGQFSARTRYYPPRTALSTAPDGRLYATDFESGRLQWFDPNGLYLGEGAINGIRRGLLGQGISVGAAPDGTAWVANAGSSRLLHLGLDGERLSETSVSGPGRVDGVAVAPDGSLLVADAANGLVQHLTADGHVLRAWGGRVGWNPDDFGICVDWDVFGVECSSQPLAVSSDGSVVHVLDSGNGRVLRYSLEGEALGAFLGLTAEPEIQRSAQAIASAPDGTLYAADTPNHRVLRFALDGSIIGSIDGAPGRAPGRFDRPGGLAVSPDGRRVYVSDREHGRVIAYGHGPLEAWRVEYFGNPWLTERPLAIEHRDTLDIDWSTAAPHPALEADGWSARFKRRVRLSPGGHTYSLTATGGARLWIGDELAVDAWERRTISRAGEFDVPPAGAADVRLELRDQGGAATVTLEFDVAPPPTEVPEATPSPTATELPIEVSIYLPHALTGELGPRWESRALSPAPLSPRAYPFAVWTGKEMLIAGGITKPCPPNADCWGIDPGRLSDGAAYNPLTDAWRPITPSGRELGPARSLSGTSAFTLGDTVYVSAMRSGELLAYRAHTDVWSVVDLPGLEINRYTQMVSWNDRLFFLVAGQVDGEAVSIGTWDPETERFGVLPPPPLPAMSDVTLIAAEDWVVVLGAERLPPPRPRGPKRLIGAIFREEIGWLRLPQSEVLRGRWPWLYAGGVVVCTDEGWANGGGSWERSYPYGSMLDIATLSWEWLPDRPAPGTRLGGVITNDLRDSFAVGDRVVSDDGLLFDPIKRSWGPLPTTSVSGRNGAAVVWTGSEILVWGGVTWRDTGDWFPVADLHSDGARITLPPR